MTTQKQLVGSLKNTNKMGRTINEQLNIPTIQPGQSLYQPQLYGNELNDEKEYDYPMRAGGVYTSNFSGADGKFGWSNCGGGCGGHSSANGWSNVGGQHSCKQVCESLFSRGAELPLRNACKSVCHSKCTLTKCNGYVPTKASICLPRGLTANCLPIDGGLPLGDGLRDVGGNIIPNTASPSDTKIPIDQFATNNTSKGTPSTGMSTVAKVGIGAGILAVTGLAVWYFKFRKKSA